MIDTTTPTPFNWKDIAMCLLVLILFCIALKRCDIKPKQVTITTDTLTPAINTGKTNAISIAHRIVIVHDTITRYRVRYKQLYDTLKVHNDSICNIALLSLYKAHNNLDSLQQIESVKKDSVITTLWGVVGLQDLRHSRDSVAVIDTAKYYNKAIRKHGFKRLMLGVGIGLGIGAGVNYIK